MADHRADTQKPDYHIHGLREVMCISALNTIYRDLPEELPRNVQVEDGGNSNWSKPTRESSLFPVFQLVYLLVEQEHHGKSPQEEHQDSQRDQTIDGNHVVVDEAMPGTNGSKPHEDSHIKEHVDGRLQGIIFGFQSKPWSMLEQRQSIADGHGRAHQSSHVKTLPAMKQARTSSDPNIPTVPTMNSYGRD
jgi:hypothetical protein